MEEQDGFILNLALDGRSTPDRAQSFLYPGRSKDRLLGLVGRTFARADHRPCRPLGLGIRKVAGTTRAIEPPNPSIELTCPGKPGHAAHVKR